MSLISRETGFEALDQKTIERAISQGRRLRARAFASALSALFSRRTDAEARRSGGRLPDCTAPA